METIFVRTGSELRVLLMLIGQRKENKSEDEFTVVIADGLWDNFLYTVSGPLLPMDKLSKAKETGTCFLEYVTFFTDSKWVKGNPPERVDGICKALMKVREGIDRIENMDKKKFNRNYPVTIDEVFLKQ